MAGATGRGGKPVPLSVTIPPLADSSFTVSHSADPPHHDEKVAPAEATTSSFAIATVRLTSSARPPAPAASRRRHQDRDRPCCSTPPGVRWRGLPGSPGLDGAARAAPPYVALGCGGA